MSIFPKIDEIKKSAEEGSYNLLPVCKELLGDFDTPMSIFARVKSCKHAFLLESVTGGEVLARYSFIGYNPSKILRIKGKKVSLFENSSLSEFEKDDPLSYFQEYISSYKGAKYEGMPPFTGGAVGFFSYDTIRYIENISDINEADYDSDDVYFVFTDKIIAFDHIKNRLLLIYNIHIDGNGSIEQKYADALEELFAMEKTISSPLPQSGKEMIYDTPALEMKSNYTKESFKEMVEKAKDYIRKGDIFQVVLSQRFSMELGDINTLNIYRSLRLINPSPYMFYLKFEELHVIGASPEILVRRESNKITLRPIAGTRPRGKNSEEDKALAKELLADTKEMAEHLMLVDLGRNDVGRVAEYSSVCVDEYAVIERYAHVMHIVSNVTGKVKEGVSNIDILKSAFPAGTVSGAPKVRAMEIIDELENRKRSLYAGSIGYFSFTGDMDTAIMLRTLVVKDGVIYVQAGAGLVYDSVAENEYQETLNKARSIMKAIALATELSKGH